MAALDGVRSRSASSTSGSSVAARRDLSSREDLRPATEACVGVVTSAGAVYRGLGSADPVRRLLLLASSRLCARGLALSRVRSELRGGLWTLSTTLPASVSRLLGLVDCLLVAGTVSCCASESARQSSVRLRHRLSAFRRTCLSETAPLGVPMVDWELEIGPG